MAPTPVARARVERIFEAQLGKMLAGEMPS